MNLVLKGRIPSKKNSKSAFVIRGRAIITDNPKYKAWHREATKQVAEQVPSGYPALQSVGLAQFTFFAPDRRKTDLSNKWESIADLLVDCGVLADDNTDILPKILLQFGGVDKENPRAEVVLL